MLLKAEIYDPRKKSITRNVSWNTNKNNFIEIFSIRHEKFPRNALKYDFLTQFLCKAMAPLGTDWNEKRRR